MDKPTDGRQTDKPTYRSSISELKNKPTRKKISIFLQNICQKFQKLNIFERLDRQNQPRALCLEPWSVIFGPCGAGCILG